MVRGEIWWASLPEPRGAEPGYRRPVLIVQANPFNRSQIQTVVVVILTKNLRLAEAPGNVRLPPDETGLSKTSVANVSQLYTLDRRFLAEAVGKLPLRWMQKVEVGLRRVLALP